MKNILPVEPEWMAVLDGDPIDLACWERALSAPHDPRCEHLPFNDGFIWTLRDDRFNASMTADEIKSDAITLIDQLNGALSTTDHAEPLKFRGVGRIGEDGKINIHIYAEVHACARSSVTATAESRDANGNLVPPLPSKPSLPQKWIKAAEENDDIADLLVFAGRADNWFDIYKTIEVAIRLAGEERKLWLLFGTSMQDCKDLKQTANFYRHARRKSERPQKSMTIDNAKAILAFMVRTVINSRI